MKEGKLFTKQDALLKRINEVSKFAKVEIYKDTNNLDNNDTSIKLPNVKAVFTSCSKSLEESL